jgi:hypothetical protein
MARPSPSEYAPFYETYVSLVPETNVLPVLEAQPAELRALATAIASGREQYRYEPGKWSVREVLGHVGDAERVFGYRAFCISRGETANLPSFDEKDYTARSTFDRIPVADLVDEWAALRASNLTVLRRLGPADWGRAGTANHASVSVLALAFILAGHVRHHAGILRSRYGVGSAS